MSHSRRASLALLAAAPVLMVACSADHKGSVGDNGNGTVKAKASAGVRPGAPGSDDYRATVVPDACKLLTGAEVASFEGWQEQPVGQTEKSIAGEKTCSWTDNDRNVGITIEPYSRTDFNVEKQTQMQVGEYTKDVPGVGEEAYESQGMNNGLHVLENGLRINIVVAPDDGAANQKPLAVVLLAKI